MKQSELAAAFGITSGAISQCVKRGMPTTSVEAAQRWREAYLNPLKAKQNPIGAFQIRWRQIEALRESDMDISGGSNVYPREVEEVLLTHPGIAEVAVLGVPDAKWGEVGVAVIVRREGQDDVDAASVLAHLDGRCAKYRWPRHVFFWDALPKSGYGKVTKKDVRRMLVERGEVSLPEQR